MMRVVRVFGCLGMHSRIKMSVSGVLGCRGSVRYFFAKLSRFQGHFRKVELGWTDAGGATQVVVGQSTAEGCGSQMAAWGRRQIVQTFM